MERRKDHAPPANWQDFEDLCLKLWRPRLIDAKKNGRAGQPQAGVDIFGRDPKTEAWVGIQCKQRGQWPMKILTTAEVEAEVEQAEGFEPPLSHFIVATTAPRDVEAQRFVRELSDQRRTEGKFSVDLFAWDDLQDWLHEERAVDRGPEVAIPAELRVGSQKQLVGGHDALLKPRQGVFFGRDDEKAAIIEFLEGTEQRIYVANGGPGVGKTEVCKASLQAYLTKYPKEQAFYVDVAGAADEGGLLGRLSAAWNVKNATGKESVLSAIEKNPGIAYIDNLEDLLAGGLREPNSDFRVRGAWEVLHTLPKIEGVRVLVSCRHFVPFARNLKIKSLPPVDAVELFQDTWNSTAPEVRPPRVADVLTFLREELDYHALSIVLTATQAYYLRSINEMRAAWRTELATLRGIPKSKLTSLDVSVAASLTAIAQEDPDAVRIWGFLAMMPDGLSLTARSALVGERTGALEVLLRSNVAEVDPEGVIRMLAPVRQFALLRMESNTQWRESAALGLFEFYVDLAEAANERRNDHEYAGTLSALLADFGNIHVFISFMSKRTDWVDRLSRLSLDLGELYQRRLLLGIEILERIREMQETNGRMNLLASTLVMMCKIERHMNRFTEARRNCETAIGLYKEQQLHGGLASALSSLAQIERRMGKYETARSLYQQAQRLYVSEGDESGHAYCLCGLGYAETRLHDLDQAEIHFEEAIRVFGEVGDNIGLAAALRWIGDIHRERGHSAMARDRFLAAKKLCQAEIFPAGICYSACRLARVSHALGDSEGSRRYLFEAFEAAKRSDAPHALVRVMEAAAEVGLPDPSQGFPQDGH